MGELLLTHILLGFVLLICDHFARFRLYMLFSILVLS